VMGEERNPWRSVILVGVVAMLVAAFAPFGTAVAVSSFGTLLYYSVTNLSAIRLDQRQRTFPIALAVAGLVGCLGLAFSLAPQDVAVGLAILAIGLLYRTLAQGLRRPRPNQPV